MSVSALRSGRDELSSYLSAFQADDAVVDIIPTFNCDSSTPLLTCSSSSGSGFGPLKAGIASPAPLWMAVHLHEKSLASIVNPEWLTRENLVSILNYERREVTLWNDKNANDGEGKEGGGGDGEDSQSSTTTTKLPFRYYEIAMRLTARGDGVVSESSAIKLLIQDIFEVRIDKLRQQFQQLLSESAPSSASAGGGNSDDNAFDGDLSLSQQAQQAADNLMVSVNGIGSQELAVLKSFVIQALNDQAYLSSGGYGKGSALASSSSTPGGGGGAATAAAAPETAADPGSGASAANADDGAGSAGAVPSAHHRQALRSRVPIRRFRK